MKSTDARLPAGVSSFEAMEDATTPIDAKLLFSSDLIEISAQMGRPQIEPIPGGRFSQASHTP